MEGYVLMICADRRLARFVCQHLAVMGLEVAVAPSVGGAPIRDSSDRLDLVIIDGALEPHDACAACRQVRDRYRGPVLLLAEMDDVVEELLLSGVADDYLSKPIRPRPLRARVGVLIRRSTIQNPERNARDEVETQGRPPDRIVLNSLVVDPANRTVSFDGAEVVLSTAEFEFLHLLARHAGLVLSRSTICREMRGIDYDGMDRSIDLRVARLRRKFGDDGRRPRLIKSVHGLGYMLVRDPPSAVPGADTSPPQ